MQRFVALIALIFAFASLGGTAVAHAHRYVSTPIVVLNHVDANNVSIPVFVQVQRGDVDLGSGIVMPCGSHYAISTSVPAVPTAAPCVTRFPPWNAAQAAWSGQVPLRPPQTA